jgi:predicted RecB family endonuclease
MTRTVEQITADVAAANLDTFGPLIAARHAQAARELADDHGYTVRQIARLLRRSETYVLSYLNDDTWIRLGERHAR